MNHSMPGLPVHHQLLEFTHTALDLDKCYLILLLLRPFLLLWLAVVNLEMQVRSLNLWTTSICHLNRKKEDKASLSLMFLVALILSYITYVHFVVFFSFIESYLSASCLLGTSNGTPLQYSCLENPTEEPGRLQSIGSLRVGHDWATSLSLFPFMHGRRKWRPTPVFLPGESQGRGSLVGCVCGVAQSRTRLKRLSSSSSSQHVPHPRTLKAGRVSHLF